MIIMLEYSPPFRGKPKLEQLGAKTKFGYRLIWLWFSIAWFPRIGVNQMARAWMDAGREKAETDLANRL